MPEQTVIVWDLETVPDLAAARRMLDLGGAPEAEVREFSGLGLPQTTLTQDRLYRGAGGDPAARGLAHGRGCRRALCWNLMWRNLQGHDVIGSGGEVNWLIEGRCGKRLPSVDLAHVDLAGGQQCPEQHGGGLC